MNEAMSESLTRMKLAIPTQLAIPTHRCTKCGALWRYWTPTETGGHKGSWSLRSERDSIAIENSKFMDQIERLRDELRRQLAEAELDARRYRWIAGHCRSTSEHWGGRWSIVVEGPCPAKHDEEGAFDAAIDAAMDLTRPAEES